MKAMILAAGRGERMRPLSDTTPKPLLEVIGKPLIVWHIERLAACGFDDIVINVAHLGFQIMEYLGDGSRYNVKISYSDEQNEGALESAGGIKKALKLLGDAPFLLVNGDVFCDYRFDAEFDLKEKLAHLILVPNPKHNPEGDFALKEGLALNENEIKYTYSGIGYYSHALFKELSYGKAPLAPLLRSTIDKELISAELYGGMWNDIGTPERLKQINEEIQND